MDKTKSDFEYKMTTKPDYAMAWVTIPADTTMKVEASSMATMDSHIKMKTKMKGGFGRFLTGESLFINEFSSPGKPGEIGIAPGSPGDMEHVYIEEGDALFLQSSAFVASSMDVNVDSKFQGMKGFFSGESLFMARCSGKGDLWFNTYGAMIEIDVKEEYVVDTGYIVAFTEGLEYKVTKVGGYKSLFLSGEGLVCKFSGSGKLWIQTRQLPSFAGWTAPFRRVKSNN